MDDLPEGVEDHSAVYVGTKATVYVFMEKHGWESLKDHVDRERGESS
jgi:hypothetical protein